MMSNERPNFLGRGPAYKLQEHDHLAAVEPLSAYFCEECKRKTYLDTDGIYGQVLQFDWITGRVHQCEGRDTEICRLRATGMTYREIGARYKISQERARAIVKGRKKDDT